MYFFSFKNALDVALMPMTLSFALALLGVGAMWLGWVWSGRVAFATACLLGLGGTLGPVANGLLYPLESRFASPGNPSALHPHPRYVVVLGSGYSPRAGMPITATLDPEGVIRLVEAIRLQRQLPASQLLLSGGSVGGHPASALGYEELALQLGVPAQSIIVDVIPKDTSQEILELRNRIGESQILLVTSAAHMPRAMAYCMRLGVKAIPAPTGQLAERPQIALGSTWLPSSRHMRMTEIALHEYLGLLAMRLGIS